tara:strand:- start:100 stop:1275 length:1176 start_codon:yes stop_codon:yes gene_type:complete
LKRKYKILYIQPIGAFSGSLKSSEEYIKNLYTKFDFIFFTQNGFAKKILKKYGQVFESFGLCKYDNTENSHYKGLRWLLIFREVFYVIPTILNLLKIKFFIKDIDLIHLNEITGLPSAVLAKLIFRKPLIVHVRSLNYRNNKSLKSNLHLKILKKFANIILAIDQEVFKTVNIKNKTTLLRNILDLKRKNKKNKKINKELKIGYIGTYLKYKGIENLIEAVEELILKDYKIKLIFAGKFLDRSFLIKNLLSWFSIDNNINSNLFKKIFIKNMGFVKKIQNFYDQIDILCFPSSLNATGRQIFEAGMFSIPVIVCMKSNKNDSVKNNYNGLIYNNFFSIKDLQKKILIFYNNRKLIKIMGNRGKKLALKRNMKNNNINKLTSIYKNLINKNL